MVERAARVPHSQDKIGIVSLTLCKTVHHCLTFNHVRPSCSSSSVCVFCVLPCLLIGSPVVY